MSAKAETNFKLVVVKFLKTLKNIWYVKVSQVATRGTPDFLICINGIFIAIELKASLKSNITDLQKHNLKKINEANGLALVASPENWQNIMIMLQTLSEGGFYDRANMGNY
jgi:hypothetical protein